MSKYSSPYRDFRMPSAGLVAERALLAVMVVSAMLLSGWWLTRLTAPGPVAALAVNGPAVAQPASLQTALRVFGIGGDAGADASGLQLTGVYAAPSGRSFATFRDAGGAMAVFGGEEVAPGVVLKWVGGDSVVLLAGGSERRLSMPETVPAADTATRGGP